MDTDGVKDILKRKLSFKDIKIKQKKYSDYKSTGAINDEDESKGRNSYFKYRGNTFSKKFEKLIVKDDPDHD